MPKLGMVGARTLYLIVLFACIDTEPDVNSRMEVSMML